MALLSYDLNEVPKEGLRLDCFLNPSDIQLEKGDPEFNGVVALNVLVVREEEHKLRVEGDLKGTFVKECVRCLRAFEEQKMIPIVGYYEFQDTKTSLDSKGSSREVEKNNNQKEEGYLIENNQFHLAGMIREHLILEVPIQPVCNEHCLGLCPVCGKNLNQDACACGEVKVESPFSVLRNVIPFSRKL